MASKLASNRNRSEEQRRHEQDEGYIAWSEQQREQQAITLSDQQKTINELKASDADLRKHIEYLEDRCHTYEREAHETAKRLEEKQAVIASLRGELVQKAVASKALESKIATDIPGLKVELAKTKARLGERGRELVGLKRLLDQTQGEASNPRYAHLSDMYPASAVSHSTSTCDSDTDHQQVRPELDRSLAEAHRLLEQNDHKQIALADARNEVHHWKQEAHSERAKSELSRQSLVAQIDQLRKHTDEAGQAERASIERALELEQARNVRFKQGLDSLRVSQARLQNQLQEARSENGRLKLMVRSDCGSHRLSMHQNFVQHHERQERWDDVTRELEAVRQEKNHLQRLFHILQDGFVDLVNT